MKYRALLGAKLVAAGLLFGFVWVGLHALRGEPVAFKHLRLPPFGHDLSFTALVWAAWLVCAGVLWLLILDHRYRCRTCLRRLRMPVATGSWNDSLRGGVPRTEYICPYGHGTLRVTELQITGLQPAHWQPSRTMWEELEHLEDAPK